MATKRMPRYDIRDDGSGSYAVFYCDECDRGYRSEPDLKLSIAKDIDRQTMPGFPHDMPLAGNAMADNVAEDPRRSYEMSRPQLEAAWEQMEHRFRECPSCHSVVCLSCFDVSSGRCQPCSPCGREVAGAGC